MSPRMAGQGFGKSAGSSKNDGGDEENMEAVLYLPLSFVKPAPLRMFLGFWIMANNKWKGSQSHDGMLMAAAPDGSVCPDFERSK